MSTIRLTLRQIAEQWQDYLNGGLLNSSNTPEIQIIERDVISLRQTVLTQLLGSPNYKNRDNVSWAQTITLKREASLQPVFSDVSFQYTVFRYWPVLEWKGSDGVLNASSIQMGTSLNKLNGFLDWQRLSLLRAASPNVNYYWYSGSKYGDICDATFNSDKKGIQAITTTAIFQDPTEVQTWNESTKTWDYAYDPDTDAFPVSGEVLDTMFQLFTQKYGAVIKSTIPDTTDNNKVITPIQQK